MFKFLEHKKSDTWVDNILVIVIRLAMTGFIVILGVYCYDGSTYCTSYLEWGSRWRY